MVEPSPSGADESHRSANQSKSEHDSKVLTPKQRALVRRLRMLIRDMDRRADRHMAYKRALDRAVILSE